MFGTWLFASLSLVAGLALGIVVTRNLHKNPRKKFWNVPVGVGGFRRANLPVGGTLAGSIAVVLFAIGAAEAAFIVAGSAIGMAMGATGYGFIDPLPRRR